MTLSSIVIFFVNLILVCYSIKKIIYISHKKHLFDEPSESRKIHLTRTPNLGGVAIFASMMFSSCLFLTYSDVPQLNYIIFASLILFILGITDDLVGVKPTKKIIAQLAVALIITVLAKYRVTHFYGFLGINEIPDIVSIIGSTFFIIFFINAFNLIDGINCLAGGIGLFICLTLSFYFWEMHQSGLLFITVAMSGCLSGFLIFNRTPARIFMGDTGSMFVGFIVAYLCINFIELNKPNIIDVMKPVAESAPSILLGLLIIPTFDTLRIFSIRIFNRKSPFVADSKHIHHRLIDLGLTHLQSTGILILINIVSLLLALIFSAARNEYQFFIIITFCITANGILSFLHSKRQNKKSIKRMQSSTYQLEKKLTVLNDKQVLNQTFQSENKKQLV